MGGLDVRSIEGCRCVKVEVLPETRYQNQPRAYFLEIPSSWVSTPNQLSLNSNTTDELIGPSTTSKDTGAAHHERPRVEALASSYRSFTL